MTAQATAPIPLRAVIRDILRNRPALILTVGICLGIPLAGMGAAAAAALTCLGTVLFVAGWRRTTLLAAGLLIAGTGCGALREISMTALAANDISHLASDRFVEITGQVVSEPNTRPGRRQLVVRADSVRLGGVVADVAGDIVVVQREDRDGRWTDVDYGDLVRVRGVLDTPPEPGNPGAFSWRDYLAARGIHAMLIVKRPGDVEKAGNGSANSLMALAIDCRERLTRASVRSLPPDTGAVLPAILIGNRNGVSLDLMQDFVRTGTVHILASAGLHVGILAGWLVFLAGRLTLPRRPSIVGIVGLLWLYALAAGGRPSVTRAVVMATVYFAAILLERVPDLPTTLAAAAFALLLYRPTDLFDIGFQLSFLTVGVLVLAMPLWQRLVAEPLAMRMSKSMARKGLRYALDLAGLSFFAQLGAAPIVAAAYNEISLTGFVANLLVVPALFLIMPFGMLGGALTSASPGIGPVALAPAGWATEFVIAVVRRFGEAPGGSLAVASLPSWVFVGFYIVLAACAAVIARRWPSDPRRRIADE